MGMKDISGVLLIASLFLFCMDNNILSEDGDGEQKITLTSQI